VRFLGRLLLSSLVFLPGLLLFSGPGLFRLLGAPRLLFLFSGPAFLLRRFFWLLGAARLLFSARPSVAGSSVRARSSWSSASS